MEMGDYRFVLDSGLRVFRGHALEWDPSKNTFTLASPASEKNHVIDVKNVLSIDQEDEGEYSIKYGPKITGGCMKSYSKEFRKYGKLSMDAGEGLIFIGNHPFGLHEPGLSYIRGF